MEVDEFKTFVTSMRSNRKVSFIELDVPVREIRVGDQISFKIMKGFGDLWRKYMDNSQLCLQAGASEFFVRIVAFPTDRTGIGFFAIDSIVPEPDEIVPELQQRKRKKRRPKSFFGRLLGR